MERDFMGLNSNKESVAAAMMVKEEIKDGFMANAGMQWAFSNKVSALPPFMSFKAAQEERPKRVLFDPSAFQPISTVDAFDSTHKPSSVVNQKSFNLDRQSPHFAMPAYPVQPIDGHGVLVHRPHEVRTFPVSSNHPYSVALSNHPYFKVHGAPTGSHVAANSTMKQQALGGIPVTASHSAIPFMGSLAGTYATRNVAKPMAAPAQLTIFYAGSVNVYEDVSPEKAQAIMFLAGHGSSATSNVVNPMSQVPSSTPKPVACDGMYANHPHSPSPCSGLSSPMSVTSHSNAHSGSGSSNNEDLLATKAVGGLGSTAPANHPDPPKIVTSIGPAVSAMVPAAVPQARKASLARFLEKRKERVMNTVPYATSRKSPESVFGSNGVGMSGSKPSTASDSLMGMKEQSWSLNPQKYAADAAAMLTKLEM